MSRSRLHGNGWIFLLAFLGISFWILPADAYDRYSQNDDATYCGACHGDFRADNYISLTDGANWGDLHDMHRNDILNGDCFTCHVASNFPVFIGSSVGGDGLEPISCMGCHGREDDNHAGNPEFPDGLGAGLRQHHVNAGVTVCANCHQDSRPENFTVVGEDARPPYYANPGNGHPNIPADPCNADGSENFRGDPEGLDNDGDDLYDGNDPDCASQEGCRLNCPAGDGGLISIAGDGNKSPDMNGSGLVDVSDFALFGAVFNTNDYCGDFDCSGLVDITDFAIFGTHFQHGPGPGGGCE